MKKKVIFVCTANMYRSRLAEIMFNRYAAEDNIDWEADSRAISDPACLSGISQNVVRYLTKRGLEELVAEPRDPEMLTVEIFEKAELVVAMSRAEHEPMFKSRFASLAKVREEAGALRFWNVYDSQVRLPWYLRIPGMVATLPTQAEESGTEHIDCAVQALVRELSW